MTSEPFWRFDTAGNTTLLLNSRDALGKALACIPAEQAGVLEGEELFMAGGEFCANACLALAAWIDLANRQAFQARIAGQKISFGCTGALPAWHAWAEFDLSGWEVDRTGTWPIVHLPGISHVLVECAEFPDPARIENMASEIWGASLPGEIAARGIIWWKGSDILPFVHVPEAGTCNIEGACGSGSIALALAFGKGRHRIGQPSSEELVVEIKDHGVRLEGPVHLLAAGELWLP